MFGAVHTESDTGAFLPEEGVLFSEDIVQVNNHPAVRYARPDEWASVLNVVADLCPQVVVPDHGPVGGQRALDLTQRYLTHLPATSTEVVLEKPFNSWAASDVWRQNVRYVESLRLGS